MTGTGTSSLLLLLSSESWLECVLAVAALPWLDLLGLDPLDPLDPLVAWLDLLDAETAREPRPPRLMPSAVPPRSDGEGERLRPPRDASSENVTLCPPPDLRTLPALSSVPLRSAP